MIGFEISEDFRVCKTECMLCNNNNVRPSASDDDHYPNLRYDNDVCGDDYRDQSGLQSPLRSRDRKKKKEVEGLKE